MRSYLELGSAPCYEECVQVSNKNDYIFAMKEECKRYKTQLEKRFQDIPDGCQFGIKSFYHDFGTYYEVVIYFDNDIDNQVNFAFDVENNLPEKWD
jgi:hypothetical protein